MEIFSQSSWVDQRRRQRRDSDGGKTPASQCSDYAQLHNLVFGAAILSAEIKIPAQLAAPDNGLYMHFSSRGTHTQKHLLQSFRYQILKKNTDHYCWLELVLALVLALALVVTLTLSVLRERG